MGKCNFNLNRPSSLNSNKPELFYKIQDQLKSGNTNMAAATECYINICSEKVNYNDSSTSLSEVQTDFRTTEIQEDVHIMLKNGQTGVRM